MESFPNIEILLSNFQRCAIISKIELYNAYEYILIFMCINYVTISNTYFNYCQFDRLLFGQKSVPPSVRSATESLQFV